MAKNVVLIGAQGAGKGTYAKIVKKRLNIPHISTGDIFREAIKAQTELGIEAQKHIDQGNLVPDELTIKIVKERLHKDDCKDGFLLDGFPRTLPQAEALDKTIKITDVIFLTVDEKVVLQRIGGRVVCRDCGEGYHTTNIPPKEEGKCDKCGGELYTRADDNPEAIKKRLETFYKNSGPIIDFYEAKGIVKRIDANSSDWNAIAENIIEVLGE